MIDPDTIPPPIQADVSRACRRISSLAKCDGWSQWLQPALEKRYKDAQDNILSAYSRFEAPAAEDIAAYQGLQPIMSMIEQEQKLAKKAS